MDWTDIILHILIAEAIILFVFALTTDTLQHIPSMVYLFILNIFVWPIRELYQHWPDPMEIFTHIQSLAEWFLPAVIGSVTIFYITEPPLPMD